MDINTFMDFIAAQDHISYSNDNVNVSDFSNMDIVYATIKGDAIVIANVDSEIEIEISSIKEITHIEEEHMIKIDYNGGELYISYTDPNI